MDLFLSVLTKWGEILMSQRRQACTIMRRGCGRSGRRLERWVVIGFVVGGEYLALANILRADWVRDWVMGNRPGANQA